MNLTGFYACLLVAMDCLSYPTDGRDHLFSAEASWLWYIIGALWLISAGRFLYQWWNSI